jgi:two-component system, NtrC family, sensor kinase
MNFFNVNSIKSKLLIIILSVTTISGALISWADLFFGGMKLKADILSSSVITARLIAKNCEYPLVFEDRAGALEILATLDANPSIQHTFLFNDKGEVFAHFQKKDAVAYTPAAGEKTRFSGNSLFVSQPVTNAGKRIGTILMYLSMDMLSEKMHKNIQMALAIFVCMLIVSYFLAIRLQRYISGPISNLTRFAGTITSNSDYSLRVPQTGSDEIGVLGQSLNRMVGTLEQNIQALSGEIAERRQTEDELIRLRSMLQDIIDSMPSIIIAVDESGRILLFNYKAVLFSGKSLQEVYLNNVIGIFPLLREYERDILRTVNEQKPHVIPNLSIRDKEGKTEFLEVTMYPLTEHGNKGAVIKIDDITEKVSMNLVMIQTEKMMSIGGLAAGMAHEINNPIGIILQGAQNIKRRISPDLEANVAMARECGVELNRVKSYLEKRKVLEYIDGIMSSGERASSIVANMLQFSRKNSQSKTTCNLPELLKRTVNLAANDYDLKKKFDFRQIEIIYEFERDFPTIQCSETEIEQVVLNLLKNAAQAMAERQGRSDPPRIWIRTGMEDGKACITVEDNGPGIRDEVKQRIFEPFFTTKEVGVGTGLGLSVSYFIITKNHNGTINFESEFGKGTKFVITLPML